MFVEDIPSWSMLLTTERGPLSLLKSKGILSLKRLLQSSPMLAAARYGRRKVDSIAASAGRPGIRILIEGCKEREGGAEVTGCAKITRILRGRKEKKDEQASSGSLF